MVVYSIYRIDGELNKIVKKAYKFNIFQFNVKKISKTWDKIALIISQVMPLGKRITIKNNITIKNIPSCAIHIYKTHKNWVYCILTSNDENPKYYHHLININSKLNDSNFEEKIKLYQNIENIEKIIMENGENKNELKIHSFECFYDFVNEYF